MTDATNQRMVLEVVHRDAQGRIVPIWQESRLFLWLLGRGIVSPNAPKIPVLFGRYQTHKEIEL